MRVRGRNAMSRIKKYRPTPAMVVALVALVFAMSGWSAAQIPNPLPLQDPPDIVTVSVEGLGIAQVECPTGYRITGGGGETQGLAALKWSAPVGSALWRVVSTANTPTTAYAICMRTTTTIP